MYVVSTVRSGGTAFCLRLALDNNITYGGELNPSLLNPAPLGVSNNPYINVKQLYHETGVQPEFTPTSFLDALRNVSSPDVVYLLPVRFSLGFMENADFYLVRRNVMNIFRSMVNYQLQMFNSDNANSRDSFRSMMLQTITEIKALSVLLRFCYDNQKNITWYEDQFSRDTEYVLYNQWSMYSNFELLIKEHLESTNFKELYPNIVYD